MMTRNLYRKLQQFQSWDISLRVLYFILVILLISGVVSKDICSKSTKLNDLKLTLHRYSFPKGGESAGAYNKDVDARTVAECILSCCNDESSCETVFFHKGNCYLIKCNETHPSLCDPIRREEAKYNDTYLVNVRDVVHTDKQPICDLMTNIGCPKNEECKIRSVTEGGSTACFCKQGFIRSDITHGCLSPLDGRNRPNDEPPRSCSFPLNNQCGDNEVCYLPKTSKKRWGICVCGTGFVRNEMGSCILKKGVMPKFETTSSTTTTIATQTKKSRECEYGLQQCNDDEICFIPERSKSRFGICQAKVSGPTNSVSGTQSSTIIPPNTTAAATTTAAVRKLTVSAGQNQNIQLPTSDATLTVFVVEHEEKGESFQYEWTLMDSPENSESGTMEGKNTDSLKLSKLIAGLYTFKIEVKGNNRMGEAYVNVTVLPAARENMPPIVIINPTVQIVKLPNSAILDGSDSSDDDKIVKYHWEEVSGPLQHQKLEDDKNMLKLSDLVPGTYIFKLTVTDSDGATNSTTANVTVIKETDYPPKANAGSDVVVQLPTNSVILYGNSSTDDKGIKSYEWMKSSEDKMTADMTGTSTPFLHLSNLQQGDYTFMLKVTDTADQSSSATVHIFVKQDINTPPVAVTANRTTKFLPLSGLTLDGSNSTDDKGITQYSWVQTSGPTLKISKANEPVAIATGNIETGTYGFTLTVSDVEKLESKAKLTIEVKELPNKPPIAKAGGDVSVTLPQSLVALDGSGSTDDKGIVRYKWSRDLNSLASGDVVNGSDHQAVLQLVNLVAGRYTFSLTVTDAQGLSNSDTASLIVKDDPHIEDVIELELDTDITQFTENDKNNLKSQISLMLTKSSSGNTEVNIRNIDHFMSGRIRVKFVVLDVLKEYKEYRSGIDTVKVLKQRLESSDNHILNYKIVSLDTFICQNNCSGHGQCDKKTKLCVCEAFWMSNFLKSYLVGDESNCEWSILYVIIVSFLIVIAQAAIVWGLICWCKKKRCRCTKWRTKKRHRYSLLHDVDDRDEIQMMPKAHLAKGRKSLSNGKIQNSSLMISESDFSSEEETLFVNHKKTNGFIQKPLNGISKQNLKTKLKT